MTQVPQPVVPVCYRHPKRETYVRCTRCDRPICPDCMHDASVGHQCPECVAEGRRTQRPVRTAFGGTLRGAQGYVTSTLIGINVLMMLAAAASARGGDSLFGGQGFGGLLGGLTPLHVWGALVPGPTTFVTTVAGQGAHVVGTSAGVVGGEYYRLITSMFLHYGLLHLAMNMWALWVLGRTLEAVLGPLRYLGLYLISGLGGSVSVYLFANPHAPTAGASGAIFGLFAALFVVLKRLGRDTSSVIPILVINLAISFVPGISLAAHLGGFVTGGLVAAAFAYAPRTSRNLMQGLALVGALVVLVVLTVYGTAMLIGTPGAAVLI
jgi:membrane associated rhomboid family serine protease